jgi:nucleoside-diphosphate kinase
MSNKTFTMIKPDATSKGYTGAILDQIIKAGFSVKAMKWIHLSPAQAGTFYEVHKERPFYQELVDFMSSGATNPAQAEEGTIRKKFAASIGENAVHGSDSDENAAIEGNFFFAGLERF